MDAVDTNAAALRFIEEHLTDEIGIGDVAAAVHCSPYHFCRVFKRATLHTPYDYLMRRRLTEAARALVGGDARVIDIALDHCFANPETFSRAFRRMFACSPTQFRQAGRLDPLSLRPPLTDAHLAHLAATDGLRPEPEDAPPLRLVGLMTVARTAADRVALWELLTALSGDWGLMAPAYGVTFCPDGWEARGELYMATTVGDASVTAGPTATKVLPAARCARFRHIGGEATRQLTLDTIHHTWLPQSRMRWAQRWVVERFGEWPTGGAMPQAWDVLVPVDE